MRISGWIEADLAPYQCSEITVFYLNNYNFIYFLLY